MSRFTFHVVGLPHTQTSKRHNGCPFTINAFNFCKMMHDRGHVVYHYGTEGSECSCTEHVQIMSLAEQNGFFRGQDWRKDLAKDPWNAAGPHWPLVNGRAVTEIQRRAHKTDFVCLIGGNCQQPIAQKLESTGLMVVEYAVGYDGSFAKHRVFASYAHMHRLYGRTHDPDGNFFDCVIPHYFDPADFPFCADKQDYFIYIGRLLNRKGIMIAAEAAKAARAKLMIFGQGVKEIRGNAIITEDRTYVGDHLEFGGFADVKRRAELMGRARAVFVPTLYLEPFGATNVEAQLCGTPVITTDWGAFAETVLHGVTGYRCRTLEQFIWAARNVHRLDPRIIRKRALALYSLDRVGGLYEEYFDMLQSLWGDGWNALKARKQLDWLTDPFVAELISDFTSHNPDFQRRLKPAATIQLARAAQDEPTVAAGFSLRSVGATLQEESPNIRLEKAHAGHQPEQLEPADSANAKAEAHAKNSQRKILFGAVTDNKKKYLDGAVRVVASLRWFGGSIADAPFIVCGVGGVPPLYAERLRRLGAIVRDVSHFDVRAVTSNKLRFLEMPEIHDYDVLALLDCDTLVVQDPSAYFPVSGFAAKVADFPTVTTEQFQKLFSWFGLPMPPESLDADITGAPMLPYFNTGVCLFHRDTFSTLFESWTRWNRQILEMTDKADVGFPLWFTDQAGMTMALAETGISYAPLPSEMNLPSNLAAHLYPAHFHSMDPTIIHYHSMASDSGGITKLTLPAAWRRATLFNTRLQKEGLLVS